MLFALGLGGVFLFYCPSGQALSLQKNLQQSLPGENETKGWKRAGSPRVYEGEDLFLYINGGAEIYHEYGFKRVVVQDYRNNSGKSISLEIFEMASPGSAYGIYTFKTHPEEKELALGNGGKLADYYLNFWKGNFLGTLTGFDEDEETVKGLLAIAPAVEARIDSRGEKPPLVAVLPETGLIKASLKYFKGNLGLYNSYQFFTQDVFGLKEGVRGDYQKGYSVFVIKYRDDKKQKRYNEVKKAFKESSRYRDFRADERFIQVTDRKGNFIFLSANKHYFFIIYGALNETQAKEVLAKIQKSIESH